MPLFNTDDLNTIEPLPGWKGRFFHSENMTFAYYTVAAGASVHEHAHPNDEVWNILEGEFEVTLGRETFVAGPGWVAVVPPDTSHSVKALTDGRAIVVDHPVRHTLGGIDI